MGGVVELSVGLWDGRVLGWGFKNLYLFKEKEEDNSAFNKVPLRVSLASVQQNTIVLHWAILTRSL